MLKFGLWALALPKTKLKIQILYFAKNKIRNTKVQNMSWVLDPGVLCSSLDSSHICHFLVY